MPRQARHAPGGVIYHVLNRAAGGMQLFRGTADFAAFLRCLAETMEQVPVRVCAYCLMGTHWHLVLWPERDGDLARFMQRLTITHVRRWVEHRRRVGMGGVYQGRYKSFPAQDGPHLGTLVRYVERNALRAGRVDRAERWRWSSLGQAYFPPSADVPRIDLTPPPLAGVRADRLDWVNAPQTAAEERAVLHAITHSRPFGSPAWTTRMEKRLGLGPLRPRGRPAKTPRSAEASGKHTRR